MSRTVVIVDGNGRLVTSKGVVFETSAKYKAFAARLLGDTSRGATLDYGWSGKRKLSVNCGGARGDEITLDAETVVIPKTLKIADKTLDELFGDILSKAFAGGIRGTEHEIDVTVTDGEEDEPPKVCTISLSKEFLDRIDVIERQLDGTIPLTVGFGNGLSVRNEEIETSDSSESSDSSGDAPETRRIVSVKLGTGLKFEGTDGAGAVALDLESGLFPELEEIPDDYKAKTVKDKVNEIIRLLKGTAAAVTLFCCGFLNAGVTTQGVPYEELGNKDFVVTNVVSTGSEGINTNEVIGIIGVVSVDLLTKTNAADFKSVSPDSIVGRVTNDSVDLNVDGDVLELRENGRIVWSGTSYWKTDLEPALDYTTAVSNKLENAKQDLIPDLETIREGAEAGSTALQSVPDLPASKITSGSFSDSRIASASVWNNKQDRLVSGSSIKTVNGQNLLGAGNIELSLYSVTNLNGVAQVSIRPNTFYNVENAHGYLSISLPDELRNAGVVDTVFRIAVIAGPDSFTLQINGSAPVDTFEAGTLDPVPGPESGTKYVYYTVSWAAGRWIVARKFVY